MGDYGSLPLIPTSSPEFDRLLVEEDASVDIGGGSMSRAARPTTTRRPRAPVTPRSTHPRAPLPDEGAAERIAQRCARREGS